MLGWLLKLLKLLPKLRHMGSTAYWRAKISMPGVPTTLASGINVVVFSEGVAFVSINLNSATCGGSNQRTCFRIYFQDKHKIYHGIAEIA